MTQVPDNTADQADFFAHGDELKHVAELCNALYERELDHLASHGPTQLSLLRRRLKGLSHHIKRAAYFLARNDAPIAVDIHNASWQAKQAAKCPDNKAEPDKVADWFYQHASPGLVVPIRLETPEGQTIELDSVDRIDKAQQRIHVNKHGWFALSGESSEDVSGMHKRLLKPTRVIMTAACCGHTWNHRGRRTPRALTLREILLSTTINWKTFKLPSL